MFVREKHYENAIQKIRVELGLELGLEHAEDAYVVFREPTEKEVLSLRVADDDEGRVDAFREIFNQSLVAHDFYEIEGVKMEDKAVIDLLFEKMSTTNKLIKEYSSAVFASRTKEEEGR